MRRHSARWADRECVALFRCLDRGWSGNTSGTRLGSERCALFLGDWRPSLLRAQSVGFCSASFLRVTLIRRDLFSLFQIEVTSQALALEVPITPILKLRRNAVNLRLFLSRKQPHEMPSFLIQRGHPKSRLYYILPSRFLLQFLNTTCLPALLAMVRSPNAEEAAKALYAVSALVRDNSEGLRAFYQNGGPALLETIVAAEEGDPRLQKKAVGLLGDMATFQGGRQAPGYAPLATPKVMSAMLRFMATGDVDMREKVMRAVHAMLANNPGGWKLFGEKAEELEKLRRIEERLEEMSKVGESEESGEGDREWQEYVHEMTEVIRQVGETVKDEEPPPMLGAAKGGRTKDEL